MYICKADKYIKVTTQVFYKISFKICSHSWQRISLYFYLFNKRAYKYKSIWNTIRDLKKSKNDFINLFPIEEFEDDMSVCQFV